MGIKGTERDRPVMDRPDRRRGGGARGRQIKWKCVWIQEERKTEEKGHVLPIQRISEVRICRYLVFWALKKVKGPNKRVKTLCRTEKKTVLHAGVNLSCRYQSHKLRLGLGISG